MSKVSIHIEVPDTIKGTDLEEKLLAKAGRKALEQAVLDLYQEREISTGTGAKLLGLPLYDFIQFLGQHNVSVFNYTEEELAEEFGNVEAEREHLARERERTP